MEINLISDTVTRPSEEMLVEMMQAKVGDDVFGEDPSVNKLQEKAASLFGMEAALFFSFWYNGKSSSYKHSYPTR
jgi:threonine aldolase